VVYHGATVSWVYVHTTSFQSGKYTPPKVGNPQLNSNRLCAHRIVHFIAPENVIPEMYALTNESIAIVREYMMPFLALMDRYFGVRYST
jgi:hypothetical protein